MQHRALNILFERMGRGDVTALSALYELTVDFAHLIVSDSSLLKEEVHTVICDFYVHVWRNAASFIAVGDVEQWMRDVIRGHIEPRMRDEAHSNLS